MQKGDGVHSRVRVLLQEDMPRVREKLGDPQQDFAHRDLQGLLDRFAQAHAIQERLSFCKRFKNAVA